MLRRPSVALHLTREALARVTAYFLEKRRRERLRLGLCEALEHQGNLEHVVATEHQLLAPVRTEQPVAIKRDRLGDEPAIRRIGACRNSAGHRAEGLR